MVDALSAHRSDQSVDLRVLPRTLGSRQDLVDLHPPRDRPENVGREVPSRSRNRNRGAVSHGNALRICWAVHAAVGYPVTLTCRILASIMGQHHEDKEHPKRERRDHEEVDRDELADVIRQKRTPGLGRRGPTTHHVVPDRGFGDRDTEFQQLAVDARGALARVGVAHLADEHLNGARDAWPTGSARPTLPAPIAPKPSSMPPENGVGLDDDERSPPSGPQVTEPRPEQPVNGPQPRAPAGLSLQDRSLMTKRRVLNLERRLWRGAIADAQDTYLPAYYNALGTQNERYFVAVNPTAHSLACLRIGVFVTADAARLATGVGGSPFTGRVSHPLDGKQSFMTSPHRHSPLTSLAWSHHATTPRRDDAAAQSRTR